MKGKPQNAQLIKIVMDILTFTENAAQNRINENSPDLICYTSYKAMQQAVERGETTGCDELYFASEMGRRFQQRRDLQIASGLKIGLMLQYIDTIPDDQRQAVYDILQSRQEAYNEILQLETVVEKIACLKYLGVEVYSRNTQPDQLASALYDVSILAIDQMKKQLEAE